MDDLFEKADEAYERDRDLREEDRFRREQEVSKLSERTKELETGLNESMSGVQVHLSVSAKGKVGVFIHCPAGFSDSDAISEVLKALEAMLGPSFEADLPREYIDLLLREQRGESK